MTLLFQNAPVHVLEAVTMSLAVTNVKPGNSCRTVQKVGRKLCVFSRTKESRKVPPTEDTLLSHSMASCGCLLS